MIKVQNINLNKNIKLNSNSQQRESIKLHSQPKFDTVTFSGAKLKPGELDEAIELLQYVTNLKFVKVSDTEINSQKFFPLPKLNKIKDKFKETMENGSECLQFYTINDELGDFARTSYEYSRLKSYLLTEDASQFRYNKKTKQMEAPLKATIQESQPINGNLLSGEMNDILNEYFSQGNNVRIKAPSTSYILKQVVPITTYPGRPKNLLITKM